MIEHLVIIGAGGFGRETVDVVEAINGCEPEPRWNLVGIVDDSPSEENLNRLAARKIAHLGTTMNFIARDERPRYVVGIGSPRVRRLIADRFDAAGFRAATLIHPEASIGSQSELGEGAVVLAGARLTTNIRVGRHAHVNPNATVGHDSVLEDFVSVNPGAVISGDVQIHDTVLVGASATVLQRLNVGCSAIIGAGAVVTKNVPSAVTVMGVPGTWGTQ